LGAQVDALAGGVGPHEAESAVALLERDLREVRGLVEEAIYRLARRMETLVMKRHEPGLR
jgi:hypothetical protein